MKWRAKATFSLRTAKWHPLVQFLPPHFTQSRWIHGQTHQPVVWWITAGCPLVKGIWSHLKVTQALVDISQASETSHSKSSLANFQHQWYLPELVNVYNYHLMVKSVLCCCVRESQLFSDPVTHEILRPCNLGFQIKFYGNLNKISKSCQGIILGSQGIQGSRPLTKT